MQLCQEPKLPTSKEHHMTEPLTSSGMALASKVWGGVVTAFILGLFGWIHKTDKQVSKLTDTAKRHSDSIKVLTSSTTETREDVLVMRTILEHEFPKKD